MSLIEEVNKIVSPVYQVGGSVRDELLGLTPKDYDFATPIEPDEIEQMVRNSGRKPYLIGKRFGTIGFKLEGEMIEVTTFRSESYDAGSRKPHVAFVRELEEDLSRRDFTINALAKNVYGDVIDFFDGKNDLRCKVLNAVGHPRDRFREDPLRMLRAARFAAQLNLFVDKYVFFAMEDMKLEIMNVARERWMQELDKMFDANGYFRGLNVLQTSGLLYVMFPELALKETINIDPMVVSLEAKWAGLFDGIGSKVVNTHGVNVTREIVQRVALGMKWSNQRREDVIALIRS